MDETTLNRILDELKTIGDGGSDEEVWYGVAAKHDLSKPWNYTVFSRDTTAISQNITSMSERYLVVVVRDDYVPSDMLGKVIDAMRRIPGFKLDSARDVEFVYDVKPGTTDPVEMMMVRFVKGIKL